jgi:hypothetical protein
MPGIFDLKEPHHLLAKLERELHRLRSNPDDVDHAFNFFTTAEHMLDWLYPGKIEKPTREQFRNNDPLLATVSHLATGAKHFDKLSTHHKSVTNSDRKGGVWAPGGWAKNVWAHGVWAEPRLIITLSGAAAGSLGATTITALELAERVYSYWSAPGRVS